MFLVTSMNMGDAMNTIKIALCGLALSVAATLSAFALEPNDVVMMVQNGVEDSAIINMVRNQKLSRPLNPQEVVALNAGGASPALLEFLTRSDSSASPYVVTEPTTVVESAPLVVSQPPSVVVAPQPNVVVTAPPTVYYSSPYYSYPSYRPNYYFGFSWNNDRYRGHRRPSYHGRPPSHRPPAYRPPNRGGGSRPSGRPPRRGPAPGGPRPRR